MDRLEFYTDNESIVRAADREFDVVVSVPPSDEGSWDKQKYRVYDCRSSEQISQALQQLYNRSEQTV